MRTAIKITPDDGDLFIPLGDGLLKGERYAEAAQAYSRGSELIPDNADILYFLGASHYQQNDLETATKHWKRAYSVDPQNEKTRSVLTQLGLLNEKSEL